MKTKVKNPIIICLIAVSALMVTCTKDSTIPCVKENIDQMRLMNLKGHASKFNYKGQPVYYVEIAECCDFLSTMYDANCNIICLSGGIAGNMCPDSVWNSLTDEVVIFENR